jgi:hypothetical protein
MDASKGRNGGLVRDDTGNLYRIGQHHAFTRYGSGFGIYRIEELTPDSFREVLQQNVEPSFFKGVAGSHHFHADGDLTVVDYCRDERPR